MKVDMKPGNYVLAVSGGVDSMVLLDLLSKLPELDLVVAHFNHGIRSDSDQDEALVVRAAKNYNLRVEIGRANLGSSASEAMARQVRYEFLNNVQQKYKTDALITAHHQDDLIETAIINILRGTGPQGLYAIANNPSVIRPLLKIPKQQILNYAVDHKINWREDSTNQDQKYLRNYIRTNITSGMNEVQRDILLHNINKASELKPEHDKLIRQLSETLSLNGQIDRQKFINLPSDVARELVRFWLQQDNVRDYDKKLIDRLFIAIKTATPGSRHNVNKQIWLEVNEQNARFLTDN